MAMIEDILAGSIERAFENAGYHGVAVRVSRGDFMERVTFRARASIFEHELTEAIDSERFPKPNVRPVADIARELGARMAEHRTRFRPGAGRRRVGRP